MPMIQVTGFDGKGIPVGQNPNSAHRNVDIATPNQCPVCHFTISPGQIINSFANENWIESYFRCTNNKCLRAFVALYKGVGGLNQFSVNQSYELSATLPVTPEEPSFPPEIVTLSPSFVRIFTQAQAAEDHGLDEIAGPGYRKALEFLIKDYAISIAPNPEAVEEIKRLMLQPVIAKYLSGDKLPVVSTRAAWLGNDEVHYERRWVGKDLADLKRLIAATIHFIAMERLVANLPLDMPDPKPASNQKP